MSDILSDSQLQSPPITTSAGVIDALMKRWSPGDYVLIEEAPDSADRMGGKIDLLAISCWRSRGFQIDAVEIKVSLSDWKRELAQAGKADFWWRHSNRFWVAVPDTIAAKVAPDVPDTWGLLSASASGVREVRKAAHREREPLPWHTSIGLMRALQSETRRDRAVAEAREEGYRKGREVGEAAAADRHLKKELDDLKAMIARFEKASGVSIADEWRHEPIGAAVKLVMAKGEGYHVTSIKRLRDALSAALKEYGA